VKNWELVVSIPGKGSHQARFMRLGLVPQTTLISNGKFATILGSEALEEKLGNNPLIDVAQGYLWFILEGIQQNEFVNPNTVLTLSAQDKNGKLYSVATSVGLVSQR
jgi:hypothetical protein